MLCTTRASVLAALVLAVALAARADEVHTVKDLQALEDSVQQVIKAAEPSVVCILVSRGDEYRKEFGQAPPPDNPGRLGDFQPDRVIPPSTTQPDPRVEQARKLDLANPRNIPDSFGSGVVLDEKERLILTNCHVIRDATKIYVRLTGDRGSYANINAADPRSDLAILQLIDTTLPLKALKLGDGRRVRKGQFVITLASPYTSRFRDSSPSASLGVLSNIRRRAANSMDEAQRARFTLGQFSTLLQVDARLHLGCSGGALLNLNGEMIGLTNPLAAVAGGETPGGFALPMDTQIQRIIEILERGEEVEYGFLGVNMKPNLRPGGEGYQIDSAIANSPASRASLTSNDYILSINGQPVHDGDDLFFQIGIALAGSTVKLEVTRTPGGPSEVRTTTLVKAFVPGKIIASKRPNPREFGGLTVDYTSTLLRPGVATSLRSIPAGVAIREILPESSADKARLQVDKIITHVNERRVNTPAEFYREVRTATGSVRLTLTSPDFRTDQVTLDLRN